MTELLTNELSEQMQTRGLVVRVLAEPTNRYCVGVQLKVWHVHNVDFVPNLGMPVRKRQNRLNTGPKNRIQNKIYVYLSQIDYKRRDSQIVLHI